MFNKKILLIIPLLIPQISLAKKKAIQLTESAKFIKEVDGVFGLDGHVIALIIKVRKGIRTRLFGNRIRGQKKYRGIYLFNGNNYGIKELALIEKETKRALAKSQQKDEQRELSRLLTELNKCLQQAKKDLTDLMMPFTIQINEMKNFNLRLINEWAEKRKRSDSSILDWNHTNNDEYEWFNRKAISFEFLDQFCEDVDDFLFVLTNNAPKAYKQFKNWYIKKKR